MMKPIKYMIKTQCRRVGKNVWLPTAICAGLACI